MEMFMYIDIRTTRNTVYNHVGNILREVAKISLSLFDSKYLGIKKKHVFVSTLMNNKCITLKSIGREIEMALVPTQTLMMELLCEDS